MQIGKESALELDSLPLLMERLPAAALEIPGAQDFGRVLFVAVMLLPVSCPPRALWGYNTRAPTEGYLQPHQCTNRVYHSPGAKGLKIASGFDCLKRRNKLEGEREEK